MGLIQEIARELAFSEADVSRIISTAPRRYYEFPIRKRSGGWRTIAQPSRELKDVQRFLLERKLIELPVHAAAAAYVRKKSIRQNALRHAKQRVILKLDFQDFFPSIVFADLEARLSSSGFSAVARDEWRLLKNALFWNPRGSARLCLSIGAPTSPFISNVVMYELDEMISQAAIERGAIYSRYADDIVISGETVEILEAVESVISNLVSNSQKPRLLFNRSKRGVFTKAGRRIITGLVITPEGHVSLGRDRKRQISASIHHIKYLRDTTRAHLETTRGWLAYAKGVEPHFYRAMQRKYGKIIQDILEAPIVHSGRLRPTVPSLT